MANKTFKCNDAYKTLDTINMWINNCDTKASIVLGIIGVALSVIFSSDNLRIVKNLIEKIFMSGNFFYIIGLIIIFVLCFTSILFLFLTISPKIIKDENTVKTSKKQIEQNLSIMFYGEIANYTYADYLELIKNKCDESDDVVMKDLIYQIHSASVICSKKFMRFKIGLWLFFCGSILTIIILLLSHYCL